MTRKEQIHATIYNAAVDAGFKLYIYGGNKIMVEDLLESGNLPFEVTFTGNDISDMDVHAEGVNNSKQISNSLIWKHHKEYTDRPPNRMKVG